MKRANLNILFLIRKPKIDKRGLVPIVIRVTLNGQRLNYGYTIGERIQPQYWQQKSQSVSSKEPRADFINAKLQKLKSNIQNFKIELELKNELVTRQKIVDKFFKPITPQNISCEKILDLFLERHQKQVKPQSYQSVARYCGFIKDFFKDFWKTSYLSPSELKGQKLFDDLNFYFLTLKKYCPNYATRIIGTFKRALEYAVSQDWIEKNPLKYFSLPKTNDKELIYLTNSELKKILDFKHLTPHLQKVADCFIFSCFTGLCYTDTKNFNEAEHLVEGIDKKKWLFLNRQKTSTPTRLPFAPQANNILKKYKGKLPVMTNQQYNKSLKILASNVGIEKTLTTHVARKTFGMYLLNDHGVPMETVSAVLGHKNIKTTQRYYAKILENRIAKDMANVFEAKSLIISNLNELEIKKYSKK